MEPEQIEQARASYQELLVWIDSTLQDRLRNSRIYLEAGVFPGHRIENITNIVALLSNPSHDGKDKLETPITLMNVNNVMVEIWSLVDVRHYCYEISTITNGQHNEKHQIQKELQDFLAVLDNKDVSDEERIAATESLIAANVEREERYVERLQNSGSRAWRLR